VSDNVTTQRGQRWVGGSSILDPDGFPLALARLGEPGRVSATVCLADARDKRIAAHNDVFADMRDDLYRIVGSAALRRAD
jgi:predicted amidohydrolase